MARSSRNHNNLLQQWIAEAGTFRALVMPWKRRQQSQHHWLQHVLHTQYTSLSVLVHMPVATLRSLVLHAVVQVTLAQETWSTGHSELNRCHTFQNITFSGANRIILSAPLNHTHTHTRLTALCPGLPRWACTRKVKPIWILLKQETVAVASAGPYASLHLAPDR